jgi:hypothetical protein
VPPNAFTVFRPVEVFSTLYKDICHQVCRIGAFAHEGSQHLILPSGFLRLLENEFVKQVEAFSRRSNTSNAQWHQEKLNEFKHDWLTIRSVDSCFVCFSGRPQYGLPCGHIVCDNCARSLGTQSDDWIFDIHHCFLCRQETPGVCIMAKPPTATLKLLSIDGGGARGVIPLVFLQALEEKIGLPYPVQENFHYIIGTSSGQNNLMRKYSYKLTHGRGYHCSRPGQKRLDNRGLYTPL